MVNYSCSVNSPVSGFWAGHSALLWWCLVLAAGCCSVLPVWLTLWVQATSCHMPVLYQLLFPSSLQSSFGQCCTLTVPVCCVAHFLSFLSIYLARVNCRHDACCSSCVGKATSAFPKAPCAAPWCINNCINEHLFPFSLYFQLPYLLQWRMRQSFGEFIWKEEN